MGVHSHYAIIGCSGLMLHYADHTLTLSLLVHVKLSYRIVSYRDVSSLPESVNTVIISACFLQTRGVSVTNTMTLLPWS